jgi:hypothetical protein
MIDGGLSQLRRDNSAFIPSVGNFIDCCRRYVVKQWGVESEEQAYMELQDFMAPMVAERDFSKLNRVVFSAYKYMDWGRVKREKEKDQRDAFKIAFRRAVNDLMAGKEPPKYTPPERQIGPSGTVHRPELNKKIAERTIGDLKSMFED